MRLKKKAGFIRSCPKIPFMNFQKHIAFFVKISYAILRTLNRNRSY